MKIIKPFLFLFVIGVLVSGCATSKLPNSYLPKRFNVDIEANGGWLELFYISEENKKDTLISVEGELIANARVSEAYDKGEGKGAIVCTEVDVRLKSDDQPLFKVGSTVFARGDGGFGGPTGSGPAPHPTPEREPDASCALETRADQALLYRLNGDRNPLHADPGLAESAGFPVPILHGLCTYGTACRAILTTICDYDHTRIRGFDVHFSAPVYPGETIITDIWQDGDTVSFQCRVKERDLVVIRNGKCTLAS